MTYASSKEGLKSALNGIGAEVQANDDDDIEYNTILKDITKGKAGR
jgi:cofilin